MTTYSDAQLAAAAAAVLGTEGGREGIVAVAVAIALAESGGTNVTSKPNSDGTVDRGAWQINSVHSQYNAARLVSDLAYNAQAMDDLSNHGANWSPWVAYTSGRYRQFTDRGAAAAGTAHAGVGDLIDEVPGLSDPMDALKAVGAFLGKLTEWATWSRILLVLGGLGLVVVGLRLLGQDLIGNALAAATTKGPTPNV